MKKLIDEQNKTNSQNFFFIILVLLETWYEKVKSHFQLNLIYVKFGPI